jgi:hypothetical protein
MTLPASGPLTLSDIQTEFGGTNPIGMNEYYAGGGLVPAGTSGTYGTVPSSGALSVQNFYGTSQFVPQYIEDVFSTWLYSGNSSTQTITNGINLSSNDGLVWIKARNGSGATRNHRLWTTNIGGNKVLQSDSTAALYDYGSPQVTFNSNGFGLSSDAGINATGSNYASWTFRQQDKFFKIVTWTGDGTGTRTLTHGLQGTVGCVIAKLLGSTSVWVVQHRGLPNAWTGARMFLNTTDSVLAYSNFTNPTNTTIDVDSNLNGSGSQWVAYFFAHNAGGFGAVGTDNVVSCGAFTATTNMSVNLGYEPQWLLFKKYNTTSDWVILDNMRNWTYDESSQLKPNTADAENAPLYCTPTQTGFSSVSGFDSGSSYIYVAIRRGPMKVPTVGTSVFNPNAYNGTGTGSIQTLTTNFPVDLYITSSRLSGYTSKYTGNRLTGKTNYLQTNSTGGQSGIGGGNGVNNDVGFASNIGIGVQGDWNNPSSPAYSPYIMWSFRRAPSVFDVVCYTGTGSATTVTHNLTVAPQMMIIKRRSSGADWTVYHVAMGANKYTFLDGSTELSSATIWNGTTPTASVFSVGPEYYVNASASTYVAYLFATLAGVSKVGSYTGTGALQTVNCGFTTGARFVLIHRIDSGSNNWFVYDSARGITSSNDPYLALNSTANEVANTNYVDTTSVGFQITAAAPSELNASGGTYIFLAIA